MLHFFCGLESALWRNWFESESTDFQEMNQTCRLFCVVSIHLWVNSLEIVIWFWVDSPTISDLNMLYVFCDLNPLRIEFCGETDLNLSQFTYRKWTKRVFCVVLIHLWVNSIEMVIRLIHSFTDSTWRKGLKGVKAQSCEGIVSLYVDTTRLTSTPCKLY